MSFELAWSPKSQKSLGKLEKEIVARIAKRMLEVAENPFGFLEKVKTEEGYKVRVGDYRIIVDLDKERRQIHILTVRHRRNAYKA